MEVYALPLTLYGIPFLLVAFLPGWRSLLTLGGLIGLLTTSAFWEAYGAFNDLASDPGVGVTLGFAFVATFGVGLICGVVVRAITLFLRHRGKSGRTVLFATLAGFLAVPAAAAGQAWWHHWQWRLPSEACLAATFHIRIANASYLIPAAPLFSVTTRPGRQAGSYSFAIPNRLRAFCGLASSSSAPVEAIGLHIDFEGMGSSRDLLARAHCNGSLAAWSAPLCRREQRSYAGYPVKMSVYDPRAYDRRRMPASQTYQDSLRSQRAAAGSGKTLAMTRIGNFNVSSDGYWVARAGPWAWRLAEPLTLFCYPSNEKLYCRATHERPDGTQITYDFRTQSDKVEATVTAVEDTMARVLSELSVR